jgi:hypothetical protein
MYVLMYWCHGVKVIGQRSIAVKYKITHTTSVFPSEKEGPKT